MLLGNKIWNQDYEQACFADLGNAPTLLEGGRSADAYGCLPGNAIEQADAVQAFIQAPMRTEVWVSLPREAAQDPYWYYQVKDPVVPLDFAFYAPPDSPTDCEMDCNQLVKRKGFTAYGPEWPSVYFHAELQLMLSIYVDDFKLSGPKANLAKGWALLEEVIDLDEPGPAGLYLGCQQYKE